MTRATGVSCGASGRSETGQGGGGSSPRQKCDRGVSFVYSHDPKVQIQYSAAP